jgi:hypothetical protein
MKKLLLILFLLLVAIISINTIGGVLSIPKIELSKITELQEYCIRHNYNDTVILLVNFGQHSGKNRMGLYVNGKLNLESVCAHGVGEKGKSWINPTFSNEIGSNLSCLGRFKLVKERKFSNKFVTNWNGIELEGLDPSNSNAKRRGIFIHKGYNYPMYPLPQLPVSLGCFVVSSEMYDTLVTLLASKKPIILYAYN